MRALGQMERDEKNLMQSDAGLAKRLAMLSNQMNKLSSEVEGLGAINDTVATMNDSVIALEAKVNQVDASVNLTCGGGGQGGNSQGIVDPYAQDSGDGFDDPNAFQNDGSGGGYQEDGYSQQ